MKIHRSHPEGRFTIIPDETLRDPRLSYMARGVLGDILSRPDDWQTSADAIWKRARRERGRHAEGRRGVVAAFAELGAAGYLARPRSRTPDGRIITELHVYDYQQSYPQGSEPSGDSREPSVSGGMSVPPAETDIAAGQTDIPAGGMSVPPAETPVLPGRTDIPLTDIPPCGMSLQRPTTETEETETARSALLTETQGQDQPPPSPFPNPGNGNGPEPLPPDARNLLTGIQLQTSATASTVGAREDEPPGRWASESEKAAWQVKQSRKRRENWRDPPEPGDHPPEPERRRPPAKPGAADALAELEALYPAHTAADLTAAALLGEAADGIGTGTRKHRFRIIPGNELKGSVSTGPVDNSPQDACSPVDNSRELKDSVSTGSRPELKPEGPELKPEGPGVEIDDSLTSGNASSAFESSFSALSPARAQIRAAGHTDVTERETAAILKILSDRGAKSLPAVLGTEIRNGGIPALLAQARRPGAASEADRHPSARTVQQAIADATRREP